MSHAVTIERAAFLGALRPLKKLASKKDLADALVTLKGSELTIELIGIVMGAEAAGTWPGEVRVNGAFFVGLARVPPPDDPVRLEIRDGRLRLGALSVACTLQESFGSEITLPLDPTLMEILAVGQRYSTDRIERAGLTKTVQQASQASSDLIRRAARILHPLEIRAEDLVALAKKKMTP
jgi:hypothetical protein